MKYKMRQMAMADEGCWTVGVSVLSATDKNYVTSLQASSGIQWWCCV